jgi:hypothetical protein
MNSQYKSKLNVMRLGFQINQRAYIKILKKLNITLAKFSNLSLDGVVEAILQSRSSQAKRAQNTNICTPQPVTPSQSDPLTE